MDLYSPYSLYESIQSVQQYGFGTEIEEFWAQISRWIFVFYSLFLGRTEQSLQLTVGMEKEAEGGQTAAWFWHGKQGRFLWDKFGVVRYFPWMEMLFCC
jgi:hypothetical protein